MGYLAKVHIQETYQQCSKMQLSMCTVTSLTPHPNSARAGQMGLAARRCMSTAAAYVEELSDTHTMLRDTIRNYVDNHLKYARVRQENSALHDFDSERTRPPVCKSETRFACQAFAGLCLIVL